VASAAAKVEAGDAACEQKHACIVRQDSVASAETAAEAAIAAEAGEAACEQQHAWGGRIRWRRQRQRRR
jgi:hypothetical protein